jgi:tetratricopeptide (TPR) repeat protein
VVGAVCLLALPATAAAQRDVFVDAFIALHSALPGTYGDEGSQIASEFSRLTAALAAWERAAATAETELKTRAATPGELALHYVEQQQFDAAIRAMQAAIAADPARASLYLFQGQLLEFTGRTAEAIAAFAEAREVDPGDPLAAYFAATRSSVRSPSDGPANLEPFIATLLAAADRRGTLPPRPFADLRLIRDLSAQAPAFAPAAYVEAFSAFSARRFGDAIKQLRASIAVDPLITDPAARSKGVLAGVAALRAKNGTGALALLENAVRSAPESSETHRVLGIVYRALGRLPEAIAQFERAVRLQPDDERAHLALGTTLAEAGRREEAERELRNTIKALPASGAARWALADILDKQSQGAEALQLLQAADALPIVAGRVHLLWRIAEVAHAYNRDSDHVIAVVSKMARLAPNNARAYKDLGLAYYRAGRDDEAAIELQMMALLGHEDGEALGAMGQIHLNAGRLERALSSLRRAVALAPTLAQARYVLARTLQRLGRIDEANRELAEFDKLRAARFDTQRREFESEMLSKGTGQ